MKTSEEIKKGLYGCPDELCHICPYEDVGNCMEICMEDALAYIQQLESRLAQAERERDAAVRELKIAEDCYNCKHNDDCKNDGNGYRSCRECGE